MALVEGIVTGIIRDAETGEVKRTFREENHVSHWMVEEFLTGSNSQQFGRNIYVTDMPYSTTDRATTIAGAVDQIAIGFEITPVAETIGTITPKVPHSLQFHQRFNPPPVDRTIECVGLTSDTSVSAYVSPSHAMVRLSTTCYQTTTETLDVFYRIQFPWEYDWVNDSGPTLTDYGNTYWQALILYNRSKATSDTDEWPNGVTIQYGHVDPRTIPRSRAAIISSNGDTPSHQFNPGGFGIGTDAYLSKNIQTLNADIEDGVGQILNYFAFGGVGNDQSYYHAKAQPADATPIQNIFSHGASADKPFFDAGNLPTGDATVALGGTWTNPNFPKQYRINITTGGVIGAAEYQIWEKSVTGYSGNSYHSVARFIQSMYSSSDYIVYDGFDLNYEGGFADNWCARFIQYTPDVGKCLVFRSTDMLAMDVAFERGTRFYTTNYPTWLATDIGDSSIETDGTVYVSCRDTGLYKVTDPFGSPVLTVIDDTTTGLGGAAGPGVYAVAVGRNDRVWILMDGGLFYSDNSGATWTTATFSFTGISDANWDLVVGLQADPEHADDRLGFTYGTIAQPNNDYEICWYDLASTTAVAGPYITQSAGGGEVYYYTKWGSDRKHTIMNLLLASPTQSKWATGHRRTSATGAGYPAYFTFGTTTVTTSAVRTMSHEAHSFVTDVDGNQSIMAAKYQGYNMVIYKSNDTVDEPSFSASSTLWDNLGSSGQGGVYGGGGHVHLGQGMFIAAHYWWNGQIGVCSDRTGPDGLTENFVWKKYGWNGAAWELGHAGSKVTHGTEDAAVDGLTIQFDDNAAAQSYFATDYYTVGVMDGIWLDGATEYTSSSNIYYRPAIDQTELEVGVIPGTTVIPSVYIQYNGNAHTWQNVSGTITTTTSAMYISSSGYTTPDYSRGGRSVTTVGGPLNTAPGYVLGDLQVQVQAQLRDTNNPWTGSTAGQMVWGMSDQSVVGNAITYAGVQYGFLIDGRAEAADERVQISVIESGVILYTHPHLINADQWSDGSGNIFFKIKLKTDGTLQYIVGDGAILYESTAPATGVYVMDFAMHGKRDTGMMDTAMYGPILGAGRYFDLGIPGNNTGRYYPTEYHRTENTLSTFYLDGTPATIINDNTLATVPAAGEIVLARSHGVFKVSDSDVGKTITADYVILTLDA